MRRCASPSVVLAKLLHADSWEHLGKIFTGFAMAFDVESTIGSREIYERLWTSTGHHGDAQITAKYKGFRFFSLLNQVNDWSASRIPDLGKIRDH